MINFYLTLLLGLEVEETVGPKIPKRTQKAQRRHHLRRPSRSRALHCPINDRECAPRQRSLQSSSFPRVDARVSAIERPESDAISSTSPRSPPARHMAPRSRPPPIGREQLVEKWVPDTPKSVLSSNFSANKFRHMSAYSKATNHQMTRIKLESNFHLSVNFKLARIIPI